GIEIRNERTTGVEQRARAQEGAAAGRFLERHARDRLAGIGERRVARRAADEVDLAETGLADLGEALRARIGGAYEKVRYLCHHRQAVDDRGAIGHEKLDRRGFALENRAPVWRRVRIDIACAERAIQRHGAW